MNTALTPYLNFNGNCAEAMRWYHAILGGEFFIQSFDEAGMAKTPEAKDLTMHASIKNDLITLMASDGMPGQDVVFGNNVHLCLGGSDTVQLTDFFEKLSDGGNVVMPLEKQFWGDTFGMLTDKFGIHWMVNIISSGEKTDLMK